MFMSPTDEKLHTSCPQCALCQESLQAGKTNVENYEEKGWRDRVRCDTQLALPLGMALWPSCGGGGGVTRAAGCLGNRAARPAVVPS